MEMQKNLTDIIEVIQPVVDNIHEKNLINFETLVCICVENKGMYNPGKEIMQLRSLNNLLYMAKNSMETAEQCLLFYRSALLDRKSAFLKIKNSIVKSMEYIESGTFSVETKERAKNIFYEITCLKVNLSDGSSEFYEENFLLYKALDNWLSKIDQFVKFIVTIPGYRPSNADIQVSELIKQYYFLKGKNAGVICCLNQLKKAIVARDYVFYTSKTGLVDVAQNVVNYLRLNLKQGGIQNLKFKFTSDVE